MGRKNRRIVDELYLPPIKDERRPVPRCDRFPDKTVFTTGYRAQVAVDEIRAKSNRQRVPIRVYECLIDDGGCGFFHTTSQDEYTENHNKLSDSHSYLASSDRSANYFYPDDSV